MLFVEGFWGFIDMIDTSYDSCLQSCQADCEWFCLVLVDVGFLLALLAGVGFFWRKVCKLFLNDGFNVVGGLAWPRVQIWNFDLSFFIDEQIMRPNVSNLTPKFPKIMSRCYERVQQIPNLWLIEMPLNLSPVFELISQHIGIVIKINLQTTTIVH